MNLKKIAEELRRSGKTYSEISRETGVATGTLSHWLKDIRPLVFDEKTKQRLEKIAGLNALRDERSRAKDAEIVLSARNEFSTHLSESLFVSGLSLYFGVGDIRTAYQTRISSTEPGIVSIFIKFIREYAPIFKNRIWISLVIYDDLSVAVCEGYWRTVTGLTEDQFQKTTMIKGKGVERRSPYGMCTVGVSSIELKKKIMTWIAELQKRL